MLLFQQNLAEDATSELKALASRLGAQWPRKHRLMTMMHPNRARRLLRKRRGFFREWCDASHASSSKLNWDQRREEARLRINRWRSPMIARVFLFGVLIDVERPLGDLGSLRKSPDAAFPPASLRGLRALRDAPTTFTVFAHPSVCGLAHVAPAARAALATAAAVGGAGTRRCHQWCGGDRRKRSRVVPLFLLRLRIHRLRTRGIGITIVCGFGLLGHKLGR